MEVFERLVELGGPAFAVAVVVVLLLVRGDLVTRKSHDAIVTALTRERDERLKEKDSRIGELWEILRPMLVVAAGSVARARMDDPREEEGRRRAGV